MIKNSIAAILIAVSVAATPIKVNAEPITLTILGIGATAKAIAAYLGSKAVIAYGATKVLATKKGIVLLSKKTITLKSGVSTVAVISASAVSIRSALAEQGHNVEQLSDEIAEEISRQAINLYSEGKQEMEQKICIGPSKKEYVILPWMDCGNQRVETATLVLEDIVEVEVE